MIRKLWRKFTRLIKEAHFNVCHYMYKNPRWYKVYRWMLVAIGHTCAVLLLAFFCAVMGVGVTQFIDKYTIWKPLITWYTTLGWGVFGLLWAFGLVVIIVGFIYLFDEYIPHVKHTVKKKRNHFRYDMEHEIDDRRQRERYRQQELEREAVRMAAKGKPKWEV